jgi:hypothetical protein
MFNSAWKIGMLAKKGAAADVTPNALNWTAAADGVSTTQTITGINTSITLRLNNSSIQQGSFYVYINDVGYNMIDSLSEGGQFFDFVVSNNDVIYFTTTSGQTFSSDVINVSDGNTLLDTFTLGGEANS